MLRSKTFNFDLKYFWNWSFFHYEKYLPHASFFDEATKLCKAFEDTYICPVVNFENMTLKTIFNAQFVLKRKSEYPEKYFWHFSPFDFENMTFKTIFNAQYVFKRKSACLGKYFWHFGPFKLIAWWMVVKTISSRCSGSTV